MRRLLPDPVIDIVPMDVYPFLDRPKPALRPWVMLNMIASADGAIEIGGTSEQLGNPADEAVFSAVRACADWILVAAHTARVERYGLPRPQQAARRARLAAGLDERPRLAVVSSSGDFDPGLPLLAERRPHEDRALIITGSSVSDANLARLEPLSEVVQLAAARPSAEAILAELARRGAQVVLSEGGPSFNAQLADADLIDELCLSVAPLIAGGVSPRLINGSSLTAPLHLELAHLIEGDDTLFARYLRSPRAQHVADA